MSTDFDYCIIGGGVIGLAIAHQLAGKGSVLLLEQHPHFGSETSSRNSEVIHAGLYYPPGSLKEQLCLAGKQRLYAFCEHHDVPHQRIGKLIVSPQVDHPALQAIQANGQRLGIELCLLDQQQLREQEPEVRAACALFSPTTGIIDSHLYMQALQHQAERQQALLLKASRFVEARDTDSGWRIRVQTPDGITEVLVGALINSAGLHATDVARDCRLENSQIPALYPCKGCYFTLQGKSPFRHLVYPLPEANLAGLGVHATLDLGGATRFGPDTCYLDANTPIQRLDYQVDYHRHKDFAKAIRRYYPGLDDTRLVPGYAGIRPKLHAADQPTSDFLFCAGNANSPPAMHLFGMESPGLTASLAIAEHTEHLLDDQAAAR